VNDNHISLYNDPTDSGSGSSLFESGEIPSPTKFNRWSDEINLGFLEVARLLGDVYNIRPSSAASIIYASFINNYLRSVGSMDTLNPINPAGHVTSGMTYEQILPNDAYSFELDFEITGSYDLLTGSPATLVSITDNLFVIANLADSPDNLQEGEWWVDFTDVGTTRTLKGKRLVTGSISTGSPTITFKASTGMGDYGSKDIYAVATATAHLFNTIPTVAQAEATISSMQGAGGFPTITASTITSLHTISLANLAYTHYYDADGEITLHKLADTAHGTPANNTYKYKVPQFIIEAASNNGGIIPNGLVSLWRYYNTSGSLYIVHPAVPDLTAPSRDEFVFRVVDETTITMTPPSSNTVDFRTASGVRCILCFSALDLTHAISGLRHKLNDHAHTGQDGTRPIDHNDLLLPTTDAHKASAITIVPPAGTTIFSGGSTVQSAVDDLETILSGHLLSTEAANIPSGLVHNDYSIKCTPAADGPNSDFATSPLVNLYGQDLGRNLYLLDKHLDMNDTASNQQHGAWRHHAQQIKMTSESEQSVHNFVNIEKIRVTNHINTQATEVQAVHGVRQRPSRFADLNYNNNEVIFEHGGGDVWGFTEFTAEGIDQVLDAGVDWRDRFITGQFSFQVFTGTGILSENFKPGGTSDNLIKASLGIPETAGTVPYTANVETRGMNFGQFFFFGSEGTDIIIQGSLTSGQTGGWTVTLTVDPLTGAIMANISIPQTLGDNVKALMYWNFKYSPRTGKQALNPADPDYIYVTNPYGGSTQNITISLPQA
jgi:hypothetical protein